MSSGVSRCIYTGRWGVVGALLLGALLSLFTGCCPQRLKASTKLVDSTSVVREVRYVERLRDTTIYVEVPVEVKEVVVQCDSSFLETSLATSVARVNGDGSLFHSLQNRPQRLPVDVTVKETEVKEAEGVERVRVERVEIPVKLPLTTIEKLLMGWGVLSFGFAVGWIVFRILRRRVG